MRELFLAQNDIMCALVAHEMLVESPSYRELLSGERQALMDAWVVAYTRPFSSSGARLPPEWPGYADERWIKKHERLLQLRNAFVAHSDPEPRSVTLWPTDEAPGWGARLTLPPMFDPNLPVDARPMMEDLLRRLHAALDDHGLELIRRERRRLGAEAGSSSPSARNA